MIARLEHWFRRLRRRISRSELAIPLLGLSVSEGTGAEPGLVLIQIDGLSRHQMERAMQRRRLPFMRRLLRRERYRTRTFYSGLPSSTPAVQAELYYGAKCAVPAFGYFDRASMRAFLMYSPDCAKEIEAGIRESGEGLLRDGSCWSNIFTGGAAFEETHFCAATMGLRDLLRSRPILRLVTFPLVHFPSLVRLVSLALVELCVALRDLLQGVALGQNLWLEFKAVLKRVFICVGLRELLTIGVKIDAARGLPIIHVNFLGYDEQAHRRGPSSAYAHWSLDGIDRAIKGIYRAALRSARRDYQVWIFSDHGQEATEIFDDSRGGSLEEAVAAALDGTPEGTRGGVAPGLPARIRFTGERGSRSAAEWIGAEILAGFESKRFTVAAVGPVAHVYFKEPLDDARKADLARRLVRDGGVPGVLVSEAPDRVRWLYRDGSVVLGDDMPAGLPHPEWLRRELAGDLADLCRHRCAGDLVLLGWGPNRPALSFAWEHGAHAGPGPEETQGFVLLPSMTRLGEGTGDYLRPADLRAAILHYLGTYVCRAVV